MSEVRGLPLLSGPPPPVEPGEGCRRCSKEFNLFLNRSRKCHHCGYAYCHSCSDYQALMPRGGQDTGYSSMNVCAFCVEFLTITAGGRGHLKSLPLSKLKKYVDAYNIKINLAVEKDDLIDGILTARMSNGCLSPVHENYYRRYAVPDRSGRANRSRSGIFSRSSHNSNPPPPPPSQRPPNQPPAFEFPRPDLAPDSPPQQHQQSYPSYPSPHPSYPSPHPSYPPPHPQQYPPPPSSMPPRPQQYHTPPYHSTPSSVPPRPHQHPPMHHTPSPVPPRPQQHQPPPVPPHASRPHHHQAYPPPHRPSASQSTENLHPNSRQTPPRPRAASAAPAPPPTLDELLEMPTDSLGALSIGALKSILFTNHVNAGMILEKDELVVKVRSLVEDEKRDRQRQRMVEEQEEAERIERQRVLLEEHKRAQREREERVRAEQRREAGEEPDENTDAEPSEASSNPSSVPPPPPPRAQGTAADLERTGLCVICQDDEANIAIVDCGHLAMCRGCSDLVMASSRECPLCRTRIVTEARLLRIFKT